MAKTLKRLALVFALILPLACGVALTGCKTDGKDTTYKVTYVDGVADEEIDVPVDNNQYKKGDKVTIKDGITRDYYEFTGWLYTAGVVLQPGDKFTMPAKNVTFTAQWKGIDSYTVTYDLAGGTYNGSETAPTEANKLEGATFTVAGAAEKVGYKFGGWNDGTTTYQPGATYTVGTSNVTLTAVWNKLNSVTFDMGNWEDFEGELPTEGDHIAGDTFTLPEAPEREGYEFLRWEDEDGNDYQPGTTFVMPDKNVTITAIWAEAGKSHRVSFNMGDYEGTFEHGGKYLEGEEVTLPEPPEFEGYDFVRWEDDEKHTYKPGDTFEMPDHDVIINAVWKEIVYYTVTYDLGDYEGTIEEVKYRANEKFNLPAALVQEGYTFYGWSTVAKDNVTSNKLLAANAEYTMPAHDVTIYAIGQKTLVLESDKNVNGVIVGDEDHKLIITMDSWDARDYYFVVNGNLSLQSNTIRVVVGTEEYLINFTGANKENDTATREGLVEVPEGTEYIAIYADEVAFGISIKCTARLVLRPDRAETITLKTGASAKYKITYDPEIYGYGGKWFKLEFGEGADGITATFDDTDISEGQPFNSDYYEKYITFTATSDATFTVTMVVTEAPKIQTEHSIEVGQTLEKQITATKDSDDNYHVFIEFIGTKPGAEYTLTITTQTNGMIALIDTTNNNTELGATSWDDNLTAGASFKFTMPEGTTVLKLAANSSFKFIITSLTLEEVEWPYDFELKTKLEAGAAVKVAGGMWQYNEIQLADSVGAGNYIVTIINPEDNPDTYTYYLSFNAEGEPAQMLDSENNYSLQITITDQRSIWINCGWASGIIIKLDEVEAPAGDIEVGQEYKTTVGSWNNFTEISLGSTVVPGDYTLQILDPNNGIDPGQYKLGVGSYDDSSDPTMQKSNSWTIKIKITADVHTLYLYSFTDAGSKVTLLLTSVGGGDVGGGDVGGGDVGGGDEHPDVTDFEAGECSGQATEEEPNVISKLGSFNGTVEVVSGSSDEPSLFYQYTVTSADEKIYFAIGENTFVQISYTVGEDMVVSKSSRDGDDLAQMLAGLTIPEGAVVTITVMTEDGQSGPVSFAIYNESMAK